MLRGKIRSRSDRGEASYDDGIFEKPEIRNRWDSPLFELYPSREGIEKSSLVILETVTYLTKTADSKTQDVRILQPNIATHYARFSEAEQQALGGAITRVILGNELPPIVISRPIGLPELRRLLRTFVKLIG